MKKDLYLIREAYKNKSAATSAVRPKRPKVPREYILFFGIYSRKFSNKYAEGNLMRYEDMSEDDKKTLSMMRRYATTGDFMAYEMNADYVKYTAFVAFVGSEKEIREIVERYQEDYGKDFVLKERVPMKPKTKEHFGGIIESKEEDKELYALILHLNNKDDQKDYYFIKKLEDLNKEEKEILSNEEGKTTSFKQGVHKFRQYFPDQKTSHYYQFGKRVLMYVAPKDVVKRELGYYKLAYGKKLEPGMTVKPKTKETFSDIIGGLNESKQEDKYILLLKIYYPRGEETPYADYKHTRLQGLNKLDRAFLRALAPNSNATFRHGTYEDDKEMLIRMGNHVGQYSTIIAIIGPKDRVNEEFLHFKKYIYGTRMKEEEYIKPKTKEHFGDILKGINEAKKNEYGFVLVQKFMVDENGLHKHGKYRIKPSKELTDHEKSMIEKMERMHSYMMGYRGFNMDGYDEVEFIFGTKKELEEDVQSTLNYTIGGTFVEEIPMKPKTRESFADIFDRLDEKKKSEPLYVLILKYRKLYSSKFNKVIYYSLKPVNELKGVYKKAYNLAGEWYKPYFNKRIETTKDWVRFDGWAFNIFRGSESSMKSELRDHEVVNKLVEDEPVPMKPETEKHFGDIV